MSQYQPFHLNRRQVLAAGMVAAAGTVLPGLNMLAEDAPALKGKIRKAKIVGKLSARELKPLKDAGFDGVETMNCLPAEAEADRKIADDLGLKVHSVLRGWMSFNSEDPAKVEETIELTRQALRSAKIYG